MTAGYDLLADELVKRDAEIARLRAEYKEAVEVIADLEDKEEKLRTALEEIAKFNGVWGMRQIARKALA